METPPIMDKKKQSSVDSFDLEEDDIIDLSDTLQDEEIIDLTSPATQFPDDSDEIIDLDVFVSDKSLLNMDGLDTKSGGDTEIIDLREPAMDLDDEILELVERVSDEKKNSGRGFHGNTADEGLFGQADTVTQILEKDLVESSEPDDDEIILDLAEPVTEVLDDDDDFSPENELDEEDILDLDQPVSRLSNDVALDLAEPVTEVLDDDDDFSPENELDDEDILELDEPLSRILDDKTIDLTETLEKEEVLDLVQPVDEEFSDEEILDLTHGVEEDDVTFDEILDLDGPEVRTLDEEFVDLFEPAENKGSSGKQKTDESRTFDEEIFDLTESLDDERDIPAPDDGALEDDVIDLALVEAEDEEPIDLLEPAGAEGDALFEETLRDLDQAVAKSTDFSRFAEQTADDLQLDLSDSISGEKPQPTILNAEPVKDDFDFGSFAEQTTGNLGLELGETARKAMESKSTLGDGRVEPGAIDDEIRNFSLDAEDLEVFDGEQIDKTLEIPDIFESSTGDRDQLLKDLENTFDDEIMDLSDAVPSDSDFVDQLEGEELLDITWDGKDDVMGEGEETLEFSDLEGGYSTPRDDDRTIAEVLGLDISDDGKAKGVDDKALVSMAVTSEQLEKAVEQVIRKMYGEKLDEIFREVIGKAISQDIESLRAVIKKDPGADI